MIIDCVSDLHGYLPKLHGGDLLIVAGDLTANDQYDRFFQWLRKQPYKKKILVAGNHDVSLDRFIDESDPFACGDIEYICDSGTEFEVLKIWGSPWTKTFEGMNPHCKAFTVDTEEELAEKFSLIPDDVDILVTHSPPWTILDDTTDGEQVGSVSLMAELLGRIRPKLVVFGHIHESYGKCPMWNRSMFVNASHVNEQYKPVNKPIRIVLDE